MADADPVDITVQIKNRFSDQIETLKGELASIQDKIEADLEINDNGEIDWAQMELEALEQIIEAVLDIDTSDISETKAKLQALDGTHTQSTHEVDVHRDGDQFDPPNLGDRELGGIQQMDFTQDDLIQRLIRGDTQKTIPNLRGISDTTETGKISERWMNRIPDSPSPYDRSNTDFGEFGIDPRATETIRDAEGITPKEGRISDRILNNIPNDVTPYDKSNTDFGEFEIPSVATETIHQAEDYDTSLGGKSAHMSAARDITAEKFKAKDFELTGNTRDLLGGGLGMEMGNPPRSGPQADLPFDDMQFRMGATGNIEKNDDGFSVRNLIPDDTFENLSKGVDSFDGKLKKIFPSMRKWMNLIAALIPMLIALAPALLGVAGAMGAVAIAGASMAGLGLMGFDDMQARLNEFTDELAGVFEPAMNEFQPFTDLLLDTLPVALGSFAEALEGVTVFEDTFMAGVTGTIQLMEELIEKAIQLEGPINQLSSRFGNLIKQEVVDLFEFFITEASENQGALLNLVGILMDLMATLYNLSIMVSEIVIEFRAIFDIIRIISEVLNNDFITGIGATIAKIYVATKAVRGMVAALTALKGALMSNPLTAFGVIGLQLAVSSGMLDGIMGIGSGGSIGPGTGGNGFGNGPPSGSTGSITGSSPPRNTYVMNVDGSTTDAHMEQFKDMADTRDYWQESENNARNPNSSDSE